MHRWDNDLIRAAIERLEQETKVPEDISEQEKEAMQRLELAADAARKVMGAEDEQSI